MPVSRLRQWKVLRLFLVILLAWGLSVTARAARYIDDPAILATDVGAIASNEDIVSLLLNLRFYRYLPGGSSDQLVEPVTLDGGTRKLTGPVDSAGNPLMGSVNDPTGTRIPLESLDTWPTFEDGEAIFFSANYAFPLNDAAAADVVKLRVRVRTFSGLVLDEELLELHETAVDSNQFFGYIQNDMLALGPGDGRLLVPPGAIVELVDADDFTDSLLTSMQSAQVGQAAGPNAFLYVMKEAAGETVAAGDFLQYRVSVENNTAALAQHVVVYDVLPRGFRYVAGSTSLGGMPFPDPVISGDGRTLQFSTDLNLGHSDRIELRYVTEITAGARPGPATNTATASADNGVGSNVRHATVKVREDLFRSSAVIIGRVVTGSCDHDADATDLGVEKIRLYLEDGRTVLTDKHGRYHIAGLKPGAHVIQIDTQSLPEGLRAVPCDDNTRFAGSGISRFVDIQGGGLGRADFRLAGPEEPEPVIQPAPVIVEESAVAIEIPEPLGLQLTSALDDSGFIHYTATIDSKRAQKNLVLVIELANGLQIAKGSVKRDGNEVTLVRENGVRRIPLGDTPEDLKTTIEFDALTARDDVDGMLKTMAWLGSAELDESHAPRAANVASVAGSRRGEETRYTLSTNFAPMSADLSPVDRIKLDEVVGKLRDMGSPDLVVTGHTDNTRINASGRRKPAFADNHALSRARAESVAQYLREQLELPEDAVTVIGAGAEQPFASNKTAEGRAKNRRVEVAVRARSQDEAGRLRIVSGDSGRREAVPGQPLAESVAAAAADAVEVTAAGDSHGTAGTANAAAAAPAMTDGFEPGSVGLRMTSAADENGFIHFRVELGGDGPQRNLALVLDLAQGLQVTKGSVKRDGNEVPMTRDNGWRRIALGELNDTWATTVEFDALPSRDDLNGELTTRAWITGDGIESSKTPRATNVAGARAAKTAANEVFVRHIEFKPMSAELSPVEKLRLDELVSRLADMGSPDLVVTGHTDSAPLATTGKKKPAFANHRELSRARAAAVAAYLREKLALAADAVTWDGLGAARPVASNKTPEGRAKNRRFEIKAIRPAGHEAAAITIVNGDSGAQRFLPPKAVKQAPVAVAAPVSKPAPAPEPPRPAAPPPMKLEPGFQDLRDGMHIAQRIQQVRVALDERLALKFTVDGVEISEKRIGFRSTDHRTRMTLYSYIGVDFGEQGEHTLRVTGTDGFGNARVDQSIRILRTGDIHDVRFVASGENVADGKTPVTLRVELRDDRNEIIPASATLQLVDGALQPEGADRPANPLARSGRTVKVDPDGTIRFQPVTQSGRYHVRLAWSETRHQDFTVLVRPHFRDQWLLVGIAEGSLAHGNLSGNLQPLPPGEREEGLYSDGRIAFFAKGRVQGKWLLTTAYDSSKQTPEGLTDSIDPNGWYTLYGDASQQDEDAPSRRKLYLKIEKEDFYALFGDFDTGLNVTELSRYQRRLNGIKTEYWGEKTDVLAFASETQQAFMRDDIRGDGTSGLYHLRHAAIVPNSDVVTLEVRDRFRNDRILQTRTLARFVDYSLDYDSGAIWFKEPVLSQDDGFNPVYIVAKYEIDQGIGDTTAGLRVTNSPAAGVKIGITGVREGAGYGSATLAGADARWQVNARNTLVAEAAVTGNDLVSPGATPNGAAADGSAMLVRHEYRDGKLSADSYVTDTRDDFGLGQQSSASNALRRIGSDLRYTFNDHLKADGQLSRHEQLDSGYSRDIAEARLTQTRANHEIYGGLRAVQDDGAGTSADRASYQALAGFRRHLLDKRLQLKLDGETNLAEADPNSVDYPHRLRAGADYRITRQATLFASQEWAFGNGQDSERSLAGVRYVPWQGGQMNASLGSEDTEYGPRVYSNAGMVQNWQIDAHWTADAGIDRVDTIASPGTAPFDPDVPPTNGAAADDFIAVFVAGGYNDSIWRWRARAENRNGKSQDKFNFHTGLFRRLNSADTLGGSLRFQESETSLGEGTVNASVQFDLAHRPIDHDEWIVLEQLRYAITRRADATGVVDGHRIVNNLNANWQIDERNELGLQYGAKYVFDTIDRVTYTGYTDLMGAEYRRDLNRVWDVGVRASLLHSWRSGALDESWGLFAGWSPAKNVWISAGWNFKGFRDNDFSGANYRDVGFNLALRVKFDQDSARELDHRFSRRSSLKAPWPDPGESSEATLAARPL